MEWYRHLYLNEKLAPKRKKLIRKLETNAGLPGIYVITVASNEKDLFDIFSANLLLQPVLHGHCPMIIGLAQSEEEAMDIVCNIVTESFQKYGHCDVMAYLKEKVKHEDSISVSYPMERLKPRRRWPWNKK